MSSILSTGGWGHQEPERGVGANLSQCIPTPWQQWKSQSWESTMTMPLRAPWPWLFNHSPYQFSTSQCWQPIYNPCSAHQAWHPLQLSTCYDSLISTPPTSSSSLNLPPAMWASHPLHLSPTNVQGEKKTKLNSGKYQHSPKFTWKEEKKISKENTLNSGSLAQANTQCTSSVHPLKKGCILGTLSGHIEPSSLTH